MSQSSLIFFYLSKSTHQILQGRSWMYLSIILEKWFGLFSGCPDLNGKKTWCLLSQTHTTHCELQLQNRICFSWMRMLLSVAKKLTWITLLTQAPGELSRWRCPYLAGGIFSEQKQLLSKSKNLSNTQLYFAVQRSRWGQNWQRLLIQSGHEDVQ